MYMWTLAERENVDLEGQRSRSLLRFFARIDSHDIAINDRLTAANSSSDEITVNLEQRTQKTIFSAFPFLSRWRPTLNIARSRISLSGRFFFGNSLVICNSSFQSRTWPGIWSSWPSLLMFAKEPNQINETFSFSLSPHHLRLGRNPSCVQNGVITKDEFDRESGYVRTDVSCNVYVEWPRNASWILDWSKGERSQSSCGFTQCRSHVIQKISQWMKDRFGLHRFREKLFVCTPRNKRLSLRIDDPSKLTGWRRSLWYSQWYERISLRMSSLANTSDHLQRDERVTIDVSRWTRTVKFSRAIRRIPPTVGKNFQAL